MNNIIFEIVILIFIFALTLIKGDLNSCSYGYIPNDVPDCSICGNVTFNQNARIVGGIVATQGSWPAQVFIVQRISGTYKIPPTTGSLQTIDLTYMCGGTLLNRYTILTAAHCINTEFDWQVRGVTYTIKVPDPFDVNQYSVYLGAHDRAKLDFPPTVKMSLKKIIMHPNYNTNTFLNDIALYILKTPATFNNYVQPACLPNPSTASYPTAGSTVWASGWGTLTEGGNTPYILNNVQLTVYDPTSCRPLGTANKNWNSQICAGHVAGGKDTCQGDSGGGLYAYDSNLKKYIVAGVVSYGIGCAKVNYPGIYTRTSYYYDFITSNMQYNDGTGPVVTRTTTTVRTTTIAITTTKYVSNSNTNIIPAINTTNIDSNKNQCGYGFFKTYENDSCSICGNASHTQNARIVGGNVAVQGSWPAQVLILQTISGLYRIPKYYGSFYQISKTFICGGTLINLDTILTAAHCINDVFSHVIGKYTYYVDVDDPFDASQYTVYVGAHDLSFLSSNRPPSYPTVKMAVKKVIRHSNYDKNNFLNDIAIYKLKTPVELNQYVQPACLPNPNSAIVQPTINANVFASGWGTLSEYGSSSSVLYNVQLTNYNPTTCNKVDSSLQKNWNAQICAGQISGGKDTCQGDSGGGLYYYDANLRKYIVSAVTSYGEGCGRYGTPGVYTRISYYNSWINENMLNSANIMLSNAIQNSMMILNIHILFLSLLLNKYLD